MWKFRRLNSVKETKGKKFNKFSEVSKEESPLKSTIKSPLMSDMESPNSSEEPPPKSKHRIKLWDSFLQKTRKIRVRTKEKTPGSNSKLEKRSSSHPNISSYTASIDSPSYRVGSESSPNRASERLEQALIYRADYRQDRYFQQKSISRSSTSLNDSSSNLHRPAQEKIVSRVNFRYNQEINERQHRSSYERSSWTARIKAQDSVSTDLTSSLDYNDENKDADCESDGPVEDKGTTPKQSSPPVRETEDSLFAVVSDTIQPSNAVLRLQSKRNIQYSLHPYIHEPCHDPTVKIRGQVKNHTDYVVKGKFYNSSNFFDYRDHSPDSNMTSSNKEHSPIHHKKLQISSEYMDNYNDRCAKKKATDMSVGLVKDRDESDIIEMDGNYLSADNLEGRKTAANLSKISETSADTYPAQEPSLTVVGPDESQQYSEYTLKVHLQEGRDLVVRDTCGTSDPYVKFKIGNKVLYKSRTIYKNLNPRWDEQFTVPIDDIIKPLLIKVYDYDRAWNDDPMGGFDLDLSTLELKKMTELKLMLNEKDNEEYMGYLILSCTLMPKCEENNKDPFFRRSMRSTDSSKKIKMQQWNGVVNIILLEGRNLVSMDDNGLSDPYVKFKLGLEKYRSKLKSKTLNPRWLEQFDLHLYEDQTALLEIEVYDHDVRGKDDFMGRAFIDLSQLEKERTHTVEQQLEDGAGTIKLLLTISGTIGNELASDIANYIPDAQAKDSILRRYGLFNSFSSLDDIGHLEVKVFRAHGLQAADFGGLSDPFCVLELINDRVQTQTEYKTLNPEWSKIFTFQVKDIHSVLEVTVFDEDRNKKVEFLGKVAIPLLRIKNDERRWYALKDRKMIHKTKGAILLELNLVFNHLKAAIRTVHPREKKLMLAEQKFKISTMKENINRVSHLIGVFMDGGKFIHSCFDWQSPPRSIAAFLVYLVIVWNFELYMLPLSLLLIFMKNLVVTQVLGNMRKEPAEDDHDTDEEDDDEDDKEKQEDKKSILEKYHAIQDICLTVQQVLDQVASLGERVKNTFIWSAPWLSVLAVITLSVGSIILFYIPLRYLLLAWGINKFTKKLRKPNAIPNNELLDFLSRVPSDRELLQYRELRPDIPANTPSSKKKRS